MDFEVGQEVFVPGKHGHKTYTVTKIGRKWVTVSCNGASFKVDKETGYFDYSGGYARRTKVYSSEDEWRDSVAREATWSAFRMRIDRQYDAPGGMSSDAITFIAETLGLPIDQAEIDRRVQNIINRS